MLWCNQVKITRALSVAEAKGPVSCRASQSREGTVWRGNLAAWLSGWEKSRQRRQIVEVDDAGANDVKGNWGEGMDWEERLGWNLGFEAIIEERSGREDLGTGGGTLFVLDVGPGRGGGKRNACEPKLSSSSLPLPNPEGMPGLLGTSDASAGGSFLAGGGVVSWRAGGREGREGVFGGGGR